MAKIIEKIKNLFTGKKVKKEESKPQTEGPKTEEKPKEEQK
jgi:hypothetical protein